MNILYIAFARNKHHQNDKRGRWSCLEDMLTLHELESKTLKEIYTYARELKIPYYSQMNKKELSLAVIRAQEEKQGFFMTEGILDIVAQEGFGFLRPINY